MTDYAADIAWHTTSIDADAGIKAVLEKMKSEQNKSRVTFYYRLAESTGTLGKLK